MSDHVPCITLVKLSEIDERPSLSPADEGLEQNLSMLCSFLSVDDFCSFLTSPAFASFARHDIPWVTFELGLYSDHTKTLQLIPSSDGFQIADANESGVFENNMWSGQIEDGFAELLGDWIAAVSE
jgi:hypothetical protein